MVARTSRTVRSRSRLRTWGTTAMRRLTAWGRATTSSPSTGCGRSAGAHQRHDAAQGGALAAPLAAGRTARRARRRTTARAPPPPAAICACPGRSSPGRRRSGWGGFKGSSGPSRTTTWPSSPPWRSPAPRPAGESSRRGDRSTTRPRVCRLRGCPSPRARSSEAAALRVAAIKASSSGGRCRSRPTVMANGMDGEGRRPGWRRWPGHGGAGVDQRPGRRGAGGAGRRPPPAAAWPRSPERGGAAIPAGETWTGGRPSARPARPPAPHPPLASPARPRARAASARGGARGRQDAARLVHAEHALLAEDVRRRRPSRAAPPRGSSPHQQLEVGGRGRREIERDLGDRGRSAPADGMAAGRLRDGLQGAQLGLGSRP